MPGSSSSSKKRQRSIPSNTSVTYFVSASEFREWLRASFKLSHRVSEPQTWWVMSAKKEETRLKRLAILIVDSEQNRRIAAVTGNVRR